jgi:hypothetical protein
MVVFSPVTPFHAAGMRTDLPVLVPIAHGTIRAATTTPEDEPPARSACCYPKVPRRAQNVDWYSSRRRRTRPCGSCLA